MFITNDSHRSPLSMVFADSGQTYWTCTELALNQIWFVMAIEEIDRSEDEPYGIGRTLLLSNVEQVEQFLTAHNAADFKIKALNIVTPGHVNGSNCWAMEPLDKVWSAQEPDETKQYVTIFETANGARYCDSMAGTATDQLIVGELRLNFSNANEFCQ